METLPGTAIRHRFAAFRLALIFGLVLALGGMAGATTSDQQLENEETIAAATLSGSFLAGQIATRDRDDKAAVQFYRKSLSFDPENEVLKQHLFQSLIANGQIDEAVTIARENHSPGGEGNVTKLVLSVDAIKRKSWARVQELLKEKQAGDLDNLIERLLNAWAVFGNGNAEKAISETQAILGAEWVVAIRDYHAGLMAAVNGDHTSAAIYFASVTDDRSIAGVLTETYLRALEAQAISQARAGNRENALETLALGTQLISGHPPFVRLRDQIESEKAVSLLVTQPQHGAAEIFFNVGGAIGRQGGTAMAQSFLQFAAYLNPKEDNITLALANLFERHEQYERANAYHMRIDESSPNYRRAQMEYALNLNNLEKVDEATAVMRELVEQDPTDLQAYMTLGAILSQHKHYEEAAGVYDRAAGQISEIEESHWNLFYRRGIAYERLKQWDKAEPNFKTSLELDPDQPDVLNYLGYSWVDMGINLDEGMDMIRRAVDLKPRSGFIIDSLGWAYYKLGKYDEAVSELERAVEIMPQDPVINDHLGDAYWRVGRRLEATFQWNHALANDPELDDKIRIRLKLRKGLPADENARAASE
jgi:tetratricopeptide (TPR) repeat protein